MNKEEARQKIAELVKKYEALSAREIRAYTEQDTRSNFIEQLFSALGWDIYEKKEVSKEEAAASGGRVDYAFKINGVTQFYLEAKKLKSDLNNPDFMKQATTYAYGNGITWAVLTNFEELRLLNAQKTTPFLTLGYQDYISDFDKLWLLSHESLTGSLLDKEAVKYGQIPPHIPIEARLFKQLREWRGQLYNSLYLNDDWVKPEQRDEIIEKLFNRLIFIRTAEDRKLEEHKLRAAVHQWQNGGHQKAELAASLREIFVYYTDYYDSDLFKKHLLDSSKLFIDEYLLTEILNGLYDIPGGMASYDFSIIDADVLGRVYEQYLGYISKVVVEKAKQVQAKMALGYASDANYQLVEKNKYRKEQGIYYTPKFVTDYIVKETVGRFIKENEADGYNKILNMKILDPACGSGSFLIRAYDELLKYHAKVQSKAVNELEQNERMRYLSGNIFGVDLDEQAVEIACLNLLLRGLANRDLLPPLTDNIKQGNSLISGTEKELKSYFGKDWKEKHPFSWEDEFKDVMAGGGFDVVIGNPPYGITFDKASKFFFEETYPAFKRNNDLFVAFIQKGLQLLKNGGYFSLILPNTFLGGSYFDGIKEYILEQAKILKRVDFGIHQVFPEPNVFNAILVLQKEKLAESRSANIVEFIDALGPDITSPNNVQLETMSQCKLVDLWWKSINPLVGKMLQIEPKLDTIAFVKDVGLNYWSIGRGKTRGGSIGDKILYNGPKQDERDIPFIKGRDIERYHYKFNDYWLRHNYSELLIPEIEIFRYSPEFLLNGSKIVYRQTSDCVIATIDNANYLVDKTLHVITIRDAFLNNFNLHYLLGILNSKLATYIYRDLAKEQGRLFAQVKTFIMKRIPIQKIDFSNPAEKKAHDKLVALVEKMMELNKKLAPMRDQYSHERDELVKEIEKTDSEIDNLVYAFYGLTDEERRIVEGTSK